MKHTLIIIMLILISIPFYASDLDDQLIDAFENNDIKLVKKLLKKGANVNAKSRYGKTALMYACYDGDLEIIKYLVEKGADVNAKDGYGYTALINAANIGNIHIIKYLIINGADINIISENAGGPGGSALMMAIYGLNDIDIIKYLVENGADVNAKDEYGQSVLELASQRNLTEIVEYLKSQGAKE